MAGSSGVIRPKGIGEMDIGGAIYKAKNPDWWTAELTVRSFPLLRRLANSERAAPLLNRALAPYNPFDPSRATDPYPNYERLREVGGPVFYHSVMRNWIVTGRAEGEQVLRAESSVDRSLMMTRVYPYRDLSRRSYEIINGMLLLKNPPDHTRLRRLVNRAFTPRAINRLEPEVVKVTKQLLDELHGEASFDVMESFASRLPIYMICEMLGLPERLWPKLKKISDVVAYVVEPLKGFDPVVMERAITELTAILEIEFEDRRKDPRDDVLSVLVSAGDDGDLLDEDELIAMCMLLMVAGHETTTSLIGNALLALDQFRDQRTLLLEQPDLAANAVDEFLRFNSPVQATDRFLTEDVQVGDHFIRRGSGVAVLLGATNRDPRVYDEPDQLRLDRPEPRPMSFGHGVHHCLGAALARIEAKVAVPAFVERFPDYSVDHSAVQQKQSVTLRGPAFLPVSV